MSLFDPKDPSTIFKLTDEDITKSFLVSNFANTDKDAVLSTETLVLIDEKLLKELNHPFLQMKNISTFFNKKVKISRIITNLFFGGVRFNFTDDENVHKEGTLYQFFNFVDAPYTKKVFTSNYNSVISRLFIYKEIDDEAVSDYINRIQWYGYTLAIFMMPSLDYKTIVPDTDMKKDVKDTLDKNRDIIESKDVFRFSDIERGLLEKASTKLDSIGATGKYIYDSGFNGVFSNNYKVTSMFRGVTMQSDDASKYHISTSSLVDGVSKKDIPAFADIAVAGAAGRALDTQKGGYLTKVFNAAFQAIVADARDTDCGTTGFNTILLTDKNFQQYEFRFIVDGNKLVMLSKDVRDKYVGKTVKMRTPMSCRSRKLCHHCLGDKTYRLKISKLGLHVSRISARLMNLSMKAFHNMSVDANEFDIREFTRPLPSRSKK